MFDQTWKEKFIKAKEAYLKRDFVIVNKYADEAKDDLIKSDFVQAEPLFKWIEKVWLDKGISMGAIICKNGQYYPLVKEVESDVTTGYKGRMPITERKKITDVSTFTLFLYEYEQFRKSKNMY